MNVDPEQLYRNWARSRLDTHLRFRDQMQHGILSTWNDSIDRSGASEHDIARLYHLSRGSMQDAMPSFLRARILADAMRRRETAITASDVNFSPRVARDESVSTSTRLWFARAWPALPTRAINAIGIFFANARWAAVAAMLLVVVAGPMAVMLTPRHDPGSVLLTDIDLPAPLLSTIPEFYERFSSRAPQTLAFSGSTRSRPGLSLSLGRLFALALAASRGGDDVVARGMLYDIRHALSPATDSPDVGQKYESVESEIQRIRSRLDELAARGTVDRGWLAAGQWAGLTHLALEFWNDGMGAAPLNALLAKYTDIAAALSASDDADVGDALSREIAAAVADQPEPSRYREIREFLKLLELLAG